MNHFFRNCVALIMGGINFVKCGSFTVFFNLSPQLGFVHNYLGTCFITNCAALIMVSIYKLS